MLAAVTTNALIEAALRIALSVKIFLMSFFMVEKYLSIF